MEEEKACGSGGQEGGDVGRSKLIDALKIPDRFYGLANPELVFFSFFFFWGVPSTDEMERAERNKRSSSYGIHLIAEPLRFVHNIEAAVHNKRVHAAGFGAEAGNTISALFGSAKFDLEQRVIFCADDAEVI